MDVIDHGLVLIQEKEMLQDLTHEILVDVHRIESGPSHVIGPDRENGADIVKDQNLLLKRRGTGFPEGELEVHLLQAQSQMKIYQNDTVRLHRDIL